MKRKIALATALLLLLLLSLPLISGYFIRGYAADALRALPESEAFDVQVTSTRGGWLSSEIELALRGEPFDYLEGEGETVPLLLHLSHGPLIWHLFDSLFAITHVQLDTAPGYVGAAAGQFSGSALLQLDSSRQLRLNGIMGFPAFDGDHLIQLRARWPASTTTAGLRPLLQEMDAALSFDGDANALLQSPAAEALRVYQQQGWTRFSSGRALTHVSLRDGWADINGQVIPLGNLIGNP